MGGAPRQRLGGASSRKLHTHAHFWLLMRNVVTHHMALPWACVCKIRAIAPPRRRRGAPQTVLTGRKMTIASLPPAGTERHQSRNWRCFAPVSVRADAWVSAECMERPLTIAERILTSVRLGAMFVCAISTILHVLANQHGSRWSWRREKFRLEKKIRCLFLRFYMCL